MQNYCEMSYSVQIDLTRERAPDRAKIQNGGKWMNLEAEVSRNKKQNIDGNLVRPVWPNGRHG